jgi:hypothetical protein
MEIFSGRKRVIERDTPQQLELFWRYNQCTDRTTKPALSAGFIIRHYLVFQSCKYL